MHSDSSLQENSSRANVTPTPCVNVEKPGTPSTAPSSLPGETEGTLLQDLGPSMSSDAATMPPHLHQPDEMFRESAPTTPSRLPVMSPQVRFPTEIWSMTLEYLRERKTQEDLTYLWTTVRHVSKVFRDEIEKLFVEKHMGKTWLHADCVCDSEAERSHWKVKQGLDNQWILLSGAIFNFSHIDENNKERAIFKNKSVPRNPHESPFQGLLRKLGDQESIRSMPRFRPANSTERMPGIWPELEVDIPRRHEQIFVVQVRAGLNDTGLPAPRIDVEKEEFSFEWKGMYTSFFRQQLAAGKAERLDRQLSLQNNRTFMARSSDDPEIERRIAHYHSSYPLEPDCHPLILARQVADWKDIVGERDWLDSSPAERLLRKQAADRALYLDDDGVLEADVVPRTRFDLIPEDGLANWALVRRELAHKIRIRVDRVKRGLVVPRSPTVKG